MCYFALIRSTANVSPKGEWNFINQHNFVRYQLNAMVFE